MIRRFRIWLSNVLWPDDECRHMWSDWSEPRAGYLTQSFGGVVVGKRDIEIQARQCLHCNLVQRRSASASVVLS